MLLELGQTPLSITGIKNAIKNWNRIRNDEKCNKLVKSSYKNSSIENLTWQNQIKNTLTINGMLDYFLNNDKRTHTFAFQRLCEIFHQNTLQDIKRESSKLRTYSLLKTQIGYETYLSEVQNIEHRTALTKFRLSNHCLNIETWRHKRINKNNRFCLFCPNYIEDEKHSITMPGIRNTTKRIIQLDQNANE